MEVNMVIVERKLGHSGGSLTITLPVWFVKHHRLKAKEAVNVHYNIDNSLTINAIPLEDTEYENNSTKIEEITGRNWRKNKMEVCSVKECYGKVYSLCQKCYEMKWKQAQEDFEEAFLTTLTARELLKALNAKDNGNKERTV